MQIVRVHDPVSNNLDPFPRRTNRPIHY
jgi:hypothetical protein